MTQNALSGCLACKFTLLILFFPFRRASKRANKCQLQIDDDLRREWQRTSLLGRSAINFNDFEVRFGCVKYNRGIFWFVITPGWHALDRFHLAETRRKGHGIAL